MEGNQTRVTESSDSDINKKLMASAVPESIKKSLKYAAVNDSVNVFEGEESHE